MAVFGTQVLESKQGTLTIVSRPWNAVGEPTHEVQARDESGAFVGIPKIGSLSECVSYVTQRTIASQYTWQKRDRDIADVKRLVQTNARDYGTGRDKARRSAAYGAARSILAGMKGLENIEQPTDLIGLMALLDALGVRYTPGRVATFVLANQS